MEDKANARLETQLDDNNYDESQLISIKIPVTYLPYYNNTKSFERVDGQIEIEGIHYKYVKRRIHNDSLELLCIPNTAVMNLKEMKNEFFKFSNDLQHTGHDKNANSGHKSRSSFSTDYYSVHALFTLNNLSFKMRKIFSCYIISKSFPYYPTSERPPQGSLFLIA